MTSSAQIEREAERTRSHLNETVVELRSRMTVGQVADQVWDLAKEGFGGDFARQLAHQAANNPMPVALMGTGLAWLMFARSDGRHKEQLTERSERAVRAGGDGLGAAGYDAAELGDAAAQTSERLKKSVKSGVQGARETAAAAGSALAEGYDTVVDGVGDMASSAYGAAKQGVDSAKMTAESAYASIKRRAADVQDVAASAYETTKNAVRESAMDTTETVQSSAKAVGEYASGGAQRVADFCMENPLVLLGAGVALGAIAGAILPATAVENRVMGEASDAVKQQAEHLAAAQVEKVERVGAEILDRAEESAVREFSAEVDQIDSLAPSEATETGAPI